MTAIDKLNRRMDAANSLLCIGLDSDTARLPAFFAKCAEPQLAFNRHIIDSTAEYAAAFKFNMAFYEAAGADGWRQLSRSMDYLRQNHDDIFTICDAKRGDIGNSSAAYARAVFDDLAFDAVTLNPYLGRDALQPFLDYRERACIVLCRTSNPGAGEIQDLEIDGVTLWQVIAETVARDWNENGNCMLVAGATYPAELTCIRKIVGDMTLLAPGIGAQGGELDAAIRAGLNRQGRGMLVNASRSIIFADNPSDAARSLRDRINRCRKGN